MGDYAGPFLDGFFLPNLVEFDRWVERVRQRLDLGYARALETLAVRARLRGDASAAIHWYRRLVEYDPVSTSSVLGIMLTLVTAGEPLEALKYYQQHVKLLRDEFDAKPNPKIEVAAERIRQDLSYRGGGSAPSDPPRGAPTSPVLRRCSRIRRSSLGGPAGRPFSPGESADRRGCSDGTADRRTSGADERPDHTSGADKRTDQTAPAPAPHRATSGLGHRPAPSSSAGATSLARTTCTPDASRTPR